MLVTSDPGIICRMNAARSTYTRGAWYQGIRMQPGHDNVFSTIDEKAHAQRRAQMAMGVCRQRTSNSNVHSKCRTSILEKKIRVWKTGLTLSY
jgi:hypothetical protein